MKKSFKSYIRRLIRTLPFLGHRVETALIKHIIARADTNGLLVPIKELHRFFLLAAEEQRNRVEGPITYFEAGVYAGQSMAVWYGAARELDIPTRIFGADSFKGLPLSVESDEGSWKPGSFSCPRPVTEWNLNRLGVPLEKIRLIEGWFDATLTPKLAAEIGRVHVAMIDADAYSSTVPVLAFLGPIFDDVTWVIFDDWYSGGNYSRETDSTLGTGVERAFKEWLTAHPEWRVTPMGSYDIPNRHGRMRKAGYVVRLEK